jgi:hypothetical protein
MRSGEICYLFPPAVILSYIARPAGGPFKPGFGLIWGICICFSFCHFSRLISRAKASASRPAAALTNPQR